MEMKGKTIYETSEKHAQLLGLFIQSNLKWTKNLGELEHRLKKRLAGLQKLKYILPTNKLKQVTDGMFNSVWIYCLPVYGGCEKGDLKLLQVLQNQASRLFTKCPTNN